MRRSDNTSRTPPPVASRQPVLHVLLVALLLAPLVSGPPASAQPPTTDASYQGRPIAPVMSYRGAVWLERLSRDEEEDPDQVLAAMRLAAGQIVVDLGCGSGYYSRRLARAVGPSGRVLAVDIQPQMLDILRHQIEAEGLGNVVPILGGETDPRLPAEVVGQVDWFLLVDVYHELAQPAAMLLQLRAALKPSGRVALVEFRLEGESAAHIKLEHRMSIEQVRREWEGAGFELVELIETMPTQHLFVFAAAGAETQ